MLKKKKRKTTQDTYFIIVFWWSLKVVLFDKEVCVITSASNLPPRVTAIGLLNKTSHYATVLWFCQHNNQQEVHEPV